MYNEILPFFQNFHIFLKCPISCIKRTKLSQCFYYKVLQPLLIQLYSLKQNVKRVLVYWNGMFCFKPRFFLKNIKIHGKTPVMESYFNKVPGYKKGLFCRCFLPNFANLLKQLILCIYFNANWQLIHACPASTIKRL